METPNPEADLALQRTIEVWSYMEAEDVSKEVAMRQLYPEYYNVISCNCFLCEYTKPFVGRETESIMYNCDFCPASLACDEPYSDYSMYLSPHKGASKQAIRNIINRCTTALAHEVE